MHDMHDETTPRDRLRARARKAARHERCKLYVVRCTLNVARAFPMLDLKLQPSKSS